MNHVVIFELSLMLILLGGARDSLVIIRIWGNSDWTGRVSSFSVLIRGGFRLNERIFLLLCPYTGVIQTGRAGFPPSLSLYRGDSDWSSRVSSFSVLIRGGFRLNERISLLLCPYTGVIQTGRASFPLSLSKYQVDSDRTSYICLLIVQMRCLIGMAIIKQEN